MSFKYKAFIWIGTLAVIFFFRYEIAGHFGLAHMLPAKGKSGIAISDVGFSKEEKAAQATSLPSYAKITQDDTEVYRKAGHGLVGKGNAGHQVTVLEEEDTDQTYIQVRYNGIAGFINRKNLDLNP